jgi:hypothetical protein
LNNAVPRALEATMKGYVYKTDFAERFQAIVRTQGLTPKALQKALLEFIQGFTQGAHRKRRRAAC